ncbi:MAG TPA: trigger factor [Mycobacteriales bacterium]|nr:trigger factor [Mycobacteriales bacterium]
MQSAVETLGPTRVRLTVEVPFAELEPELKEAYRTIGGQVRVQGFRPGKVPPAILDQRVGRGVVLEEAVQKALPRLYSEAVNEAGVAPVGRPEVDITELADRERLAFTAEVEVRPEIELPAYDDLAVTVDDATVAEEDLQEQLDALRERFASLTPVERAAASGDFVTLDLLARVDGEEVPGGSATDLSYEVGKGDLLDGLDEAVAGASAGDVRTFPTVLVAGEFEGREAQVEVTVKAVNERSLPEVDDAFAESVGFETADALRDDVRDRLERMKKLQQGVDARDKVLDALLEKVDVPLPPSVVEAEQEWRTEQVKQQLAQTGLTLDLYLEQEGKNEEEFTEELREGAEKAVKAQLVLDAVADKEQLGVSDAELTEQVVRRAQQTGVSPDELAQQIVQSGQLAGLVSEVRRGKALATVMSAATVTDASGDVVDLEALRGQTGAGDVPPDVQTDDAGRRYHVHDDGTVHYLGE